METPSGEPDGLPGLPVEIHAQKPDPEFVMVIIVRVHADKLFLALEEAVVYSQVLLKEDIIKLTSKISFSSSTTCGEEK